MKYMHKLGYITLGGLLMLIGMTATSVFLPNLVAQKSGSQTGSTEADEEYVTTFKTVMCNKLMVVDGLGRMAVLLDATDYGGTASLWDNKGKPTISLHSTDNAGSLYLHNKAAQPVINLRATENGGTVAVKANTGEGTAILGIGKNNKGFTKTN